MVCIFESLEPHDEPHIFQKLEHSRVVKNGNNTMDPIEHVGDVLLSHVGQKGLMRNILHVPTIAKNLVFDGQIAD